MQPLIRVSLGLVMLAPGCAVAARQPIIYPAKGQSPQRQQSDTADCQLWAKQTTGVNPIVLAQQASQSGAAPGAAGGAIAGDAGKGAAIGAVVGTAAAGIAKHRTEQAAAARSQSNQQQVSQQLATYNRATAACMTSRGYTV